MEQIRTAFGKMPLSEEEYAETYKGFMEAWESKDIAGVYLNSNKMLMSMTMVVELQQRIINELEKVGTEAG